MNKYFFVIDQTTYAKKLRIAQYNSCSATQYPFDLHDKNKKHINRSLFTEPLNEPNLSYIYLRNN